MCVYVYVCVKGIVENKNTPMRIKKKLLSRLPSTFLKNLFCDMLCQNEGVH